MPNDEQAEQAVEQKLRDMGEDPSETEGKQQEEPEYDETRPTQEIVEEYEQTVGKEGEEDGEKPAMDMRLLAQAVGLTDEQLDARIRARGEDSVRTELEEAREGILKEFTFITGPGNATSGPGLHNQGIPGVPQGMPQLDRPPATGQVSGTQWPQAPAQQQPGSSGESLADLTDEQIEQAREEYGDLYADNLKRMRNDARMQRQLIAQQQQAEAARQVAEVDRWYDEIAKEGYGHVFGESREKADARQLQMREHVLLTAAGIRQAHLARGQDISPRAAWSRAVLAVAADARRDSARRQVEQQVRKRSEAVGLPPTGPGSGMTRSMPKEVQAVRAIENWYRNKGFSVPEGD